MKELYLIDASAYIFRAWFGMPDVFFDAEKRPLNALYGFGLFIRDWLLRYQPSHAVFCFDESLETGFRHKLYPAYKANRALPDESLEYQLRSCRNLAEAMGLCCIASDNFEADDLIGSLAKQAKISATPTVILTTDKDLSQLTHAGCIIDPFHKEGIIDELVFQQLYGFEPSLLADYLALAGDAVDNIPGIAGIGKKTAQRLIQTFGKLESLYEGLHAGVKLSEMRGFDSIKAKLLAEQDDAFLFRELTRIHCDAAVPSGDAEWRIRKPQKSILEGALKQWAMEKRLQSLSALLD